MRLQQSLTHDRDYLAGRVTHVPRPDTRAGATALGLNRWHHLTFQFQGSTITAAVDGTTVRTLSDTAFTTGQVGIGVVGYQTDQFDNFTVTPGFGGGPPTGPITSGIAGKCVDDNGNGSANGTKVQLWDCNGGTNQQWTAQANGALVSVQSGRCLDDPGFATANGTQLEIWDCNGGANQRWTLPS
jgi:hypothetical protein